MVFGIPQNDFTGTQDLFPTLLTLVALPENQLALRAQTCFPAVAPLRWQGARKNLQIVPHKNRFEA
jgi:hypothetical protein